MSSQSGIMSKGVHVQVGRPPSAQPIAGQPPSATASFVPPSTLPSVPAIPQCPGCPLTWDPAVFWSTYPFHVHEPTSRYNPGYQFISFSPLLIRSARCLGSSGNPGKPCTRCSTLPFDVAALRDRAKEPFNLVRTEERMNHVQLLEKVADLKEQVNDLKLKTVNLERSLASARDDVAEYKAIFHFLGTNTVPALHRMFPNALTQEWGSKKFFHQIQAASRGDYIPRSYTQYEIDLAILLYELGGGSAVHAMNHSIFALPSLKTLQPYRREHKPKPCLDHANLLTISNNITTMFGSHEEKGGKSREAPVKICGHTLMFDEIATERKVEYMSTTDEMAGFCLEHVDALKSLTVGKDTTTVEAAVTAVKEGKVHIAHEATVGAISHLSRHDYGAKPVFIGPTCKKGSWRTMLETMLSVLEAWKHSPDGEAKHGRIIEILPGNPLYPLIYYRHIFKRICTLLCSWMGMLVKGVCVNRDLLVLWFERLPNHDWSEMSIENLLHPKDAQCVFRAVKLLLCIVEIQTIDKTTLDPSEEAEYEALCLLGKVFEFLLEPFINPHLSLSQQITSLVTFAHLACGLFLQNSTSFMSNQLYGDLQAMVKAAIIMVAQTKVLDPRLDVLLCLLGDNPVETLFGRSRMCGGHSPNCSISELWTRFCSAMNLDNVFKHHPELEKTPRRLKLVRARDTDHVGPTQWVGKISADSCDIDLCYDEGVDVAESIMREHSVSEPKSFAEHFQPLEKDLLRPFGGKYPALSPEIDRSVVNTSPPSDTSSDDTTINPVFLFDYDARLGLDEAQRIATSNDPHSVFAVIDSEGQLCHKKAIVRTFFETQNNQISKDRLQRIRGFTIGGKTWEREETDSEMVSSSTHFQLGNLFATFICYNGTHLGLALAKSTIIKRGIPGSKSPSVSAIPIAELGLPSSPFTICGQIFSLLPLK
ncbi:hypothetical protein MVEN_01142400 [Mycena venus]|uniref:Uncharacterized protein n=1 Tax=Mycena venus TaxID=2733690 RepID=A0A8H6Y0K1_9AGAR|nr:hypothetical protein MVEN_01142400 [Mycena venus]